MASTPCRPRTADALRAFKSANPNQSSYARAPSRADTRRRGICDQQRHGIASVVFSTPKLSVTVGGNAAFYSAVLTCAPEHPVTVRPTNIPSGIRVSPSLYVFTMDTWSLPQFFRVAAVSGNALEDSSLHNPQKSQTIEHLSSSLDSRFDGSRVMFVPPTIAAVVTTRNGCSLFTSGRVLGTAQLPGTFTPTTPANRPPMAAAMLAQSHHQFAEVDLQGVAQDHGALVARSTMLVQQAAVPVRKAAAAAAMAAVDAANTATTEAAAMLERRRTRRDNLLMSEVSSHAAATKLSTSSGDGGGFSAAIAVLNDSSALVRVASRGNHSVALYRSGTLLPLGKLFESDTITSEPVSDGDQTAQGTDAALSRMLVDVTCGDHHIVATTEQGYLLTWGDGRDGQLGHGGTGGIYANALSLRAPQVIKSLLHKRIVHVACGARHTVALAEDGDVFSWGYGKCGALGHGASETDQAFTSVSTPKEIASLKNQRVVRIACGDMHTSVVLSNGSLLTCGWAEHGRLGRPCHSSKNTASDIANSSYSAYLQPVDLRSKRCTFIVCGAAHTLLLTDCNSVLAFGWNVNGQLGVGDCRNRFVPTRVDYFDPQYHVVASLAAGKLHSLAATSDGRLFAWGNDELGQCGVGAFPQIYTIPHLVVSMVGLHVTQLAAADGHSVVLTLGSQQHLNALEENHPQQYARLMDKFERAVDEDEQRRAVVFSLSKQKHLDYEAVVRKRKPLVDLSTSLAKVLQQQALVEQDAKQYERQVKRASTAGTTPAVLAATGRRPHTAGVASSNRVPLRHSESGSTYGVSKDRDPSSVPDEVMECVEGETRPPKPVRCSSAAMWRRSKLSTLPPSNTGVAMSLNYRPQTASRSGTRPGHRPQTAQPLSSAGTRANVVKLSKDARAQLGKMLNGEVAPRQIEPSRTISSTESHEAAPVPLFPTSRPKSAPLHVRSRQ